MFKKLISGLLLFIVSFGITNAQSMSFTITTKTYNGHYAPNNTFVLWITNSAGGYVKTINRQSNRFTYSLSTWSSNSNDKTVDGVTGASLSSHNYAYTSTSNTVKRIPFNWDFKDYNGNLVADGTYYINVEFSEYQGSHQYIKYPFTKGSSTYSIVPTPVTANAYFSNPSLTYTAPTVAIPTFETSRFNVVYDQKERSLKIAYDATSHPKPQLRLINQNGQTIFRCVLWGVGSEIIPLPNVPEGMYILYLSDKKGWKQTQKIVL